MINKTLKSLDVGFNNIGRQAALSLISIFLRLELEKVGLAGCELGNDEAGYIAKYVRSRGEWLTHLDLQSNYITRAKKTLNDAAHDHNVILYLGLLQCLRKLKHYDTHFPFFIRLGVLNGRRRTFFAVHVKAMSSSPCCSDDTKFDTQLYEHFASELKGKPWDRNATATCEMLEDDMTLRCRITAPRVILPSQLKDLRYFGRCSKLNDNQAECTKKIYASPDRNLPNCHDYNEFPEGCEECWACKLESCPTNWVQDGWTEFGFDVSPPANQCGAKYGSSKSCAIGVIRCKKP